ncbi:TPA: hypothetical protein SMP28_001036 [Proteus mirabilis]|nr:hypothetical protein [Proteus mirabilis]HEK0608155.1 hypothetical protein [Proteus mirabilis]HEK2812245.1 hypothetical protein [Proteus mirabilis]HEK2830193.1 hypothetical protein [Proteus mirabilis]
MEFKGTPAPWVADIRSGCCAVYQKNRANDTAGCHRDDDRNIVYSSKDARYDEKLHHWVMDEETKADFTLIAAAPELLGQLIRLRNKIASYKPDDNDNLDIVDTVIAKALGQQ